MKSKKEIEKVPHKVRQWLKGLEHMLCKLGALVQTPELPGPFKVSRNKPNPNPKSELSKPGATRQK